MSGDDFLSRWSRLKREARKGGETPTAERPPAAPPPAAAVSAGAPAAAAEPPAPLPPVESLTPESDFAPFMKAEVDPGTRRQALKTLFQDPRYNVMDGLDTYIADYSLPDPLPEGWLEKMNQVARLGEYLAPEEKERRAAAAEKEARDAGTDAAAAHPMEASRVTEESPAEPASSPSEVEAFPTRTA